MAANNQAINDKTKRAIMMWQGKSDVVDKPYQTFPKKDYRYVVTEHLSDGDHARCIKALSGLHVTTFSSLNTFTDT